jgi:hypothetical protein
MERDRLKSLLIVLIFIEVLLVLALYVHFTALPPSSRSMAKAVQAWHENPTAENREKLDSLRRREHRKQMFGIGLTFTLLCLNTYGIARVRKVIKSKSLQ